jgi:hypothetical protein
MEDEEVRRRKRERERERRIKKQENKLSQNQIKSNQIMQPIHRSVSFFSSSLVLFRFAMWFYGLRFNETGVTHGAILKQSAHHAVDHPKLARRADLQTKPTVGGLSGPQGPIQRDAINAVKRVKRNLRNCAIRYS